MWAVMSRFGHETLPDDLNGPNVHRLENVMTMAPNVHTLFDQLMIWLTATVRQFDHVIWKLSHIVMLIKGKRTSINSKE